MKPVSPEANLLTLDQVAASPLARNSTEGVRPPVDPVVHYEYIDALRGLAFLMVLLCHSEIWASFGHTPLELLLDRFLSRGVYGVQLFFVISAFTLFQSMDVRSQRDVRPARAFFVRRFFRIAPLFWSAMVFYLVWYGLQPRDFAPGGITASNVALNAAFLHGWHPATINSLVPGGWSIAVEMMFYLMLPSLYRWFRTPRRLVILLAMALFISWAISSKNLAGLIYPNWNRVNPGLVSVFGYYWLPSQFPVFVLGILLYTLRRATRPGPDGSISVDRSPLCWSMTGLMLVFFLKLFISVPDFLYCSTVFCLMAWILSIHPNRILVNRGNMLSRQGQLQRLFDPLRGARRHRAASRDRIEGDPRPVRDPEPLPPDHDFDRVMARPRPPRHHPCGDLAIDDRPMHSHISFHRGTRDSTREKSHPTMGLVTVGTSSRSPNILRPSLRRAGRGPSTRSATGTSLRSTPTRARTPDRPWSKSLKAAGRQWTTAGSPLGYRLTDQLVSPRPFQRSKINSQAH